MAQHSPSSPHYRHQSSLENIIKLQPEFPLSPDARDRSRRRFYHIVDHFEATAENGNSNRDNGGNDGGGGGSNKPPYNRSRLIRLTYDHARSPLSQDNFLRAFFGSLELSMDGNEALDEQISEKFFSFADYLFYNFFLPLKASARKTPQPSPASHSVIQRLQEERDDSVGTPHIISALRAICLIRDRHRCVVTRRFDSSEALSRFASAGDDARDDDGTLLNEEQPGSFEPLEVAHILPHSLTKLGRGKELNSAKQAALTILNIFDHGIGHLIEGVEIDRPRNALTLTHYMHDLFGNFHISFEPVPDAEPHTYRIESFVRPALVRGLLPVTRTLFLTDSRTIDPPSARLLAIHRAIARILHLSAAGAYIDNILRDVEDAETHGVQADGSTDLGLLVHLGLWRDGVD
ncbi:uncharacterized protein P884DRAFT_267403 [Thermothelomyces heterothallicus CBS 202.75]|uniref:uncharacterized protein n=1 Tax=Thermothelomyces heterothallicus CBS 202.75 TaxID=1149848 RepID=UPI0037421C55